MQKIYCICPCCGEKCHVSVEIFTELQKFALLRGEIVQVLEATDNDMEDFESYKK